MEQWSLGCLNSVGHGLNERGGFAELDTIFPISWVHEIMRIVLGLAIALATVCFIGFDIVGFFSRKLTVPGSSLVAVSAANLLIFFPAYFILCDAYAAVLMMIVLPGVINLFLLHDEYRS